MNYSYLKKETAPKILVEAYKLIGTAETIGKDNNPKILDWADQLGLKKTYTADEIPWCGLFMAIVATGTTTNFANFSFSANGVSTRLLKKKLK